MKKFDLIDRILEEKGLYEEEEPVADGTPPVEETEGNKEVGDPTEDKDLLVRHNTGKDDSDSAEALKDWFDINAKKGDKKRDALFESLIAGILEQDEINDGEMPEGVSPEEFKADNEKTEEEKAKEDAGNSPAAEIKESRIRRRFLKIVREADEAEEKAEEAEEKAEDAEEKAEDSGEKKDEEKAEELKEIARILRRKSRRLREQAEEIASKILEEQEEATEDKEDHEEPDGDEDEEGNESGDAVKEWVSTILDTIKLLEEEDPIAAGTPSDEINLDDVTDDNEDYALRSAEAAPTTEDELED